MCALYPGAFGDNEDWEFCSSLRTALSAPYYYGVFHSFGSTVIFLTRNTRAARSSYFSKVFVSFCMFCVCKTFICDNSRWFQLYL